MFLLSVLLNNMSQFLGLLPKIVLIVFVRIMTILTAFYKQKFAFVHLSEGLKALSSVSNKNQDIRMHVRSTKGSSGKVLVRNLSRVSRPESGCNLAATQAHSTLGAPKLDTMDR